jgi:hypothetical protein
MYESERVYHLLPPSATMSTTEGIASGGAPGKDCKTATTPLSRCAQS